MIESRVCIHAWQGHYATCSSHSAQYYIPRGTEYLERSVSTEVFISTNNPKAESGVVQWFESTNQRPCTPNPHCKYSFDLKIDILLLPVQVFL